MTGPAMTTRGWRHDMFVYAADDAFARLVGPYLEEGLEEGEAAMAVFVPHKQTLLRDALGSSAGEVEFTDANEVYTSPEAVLARYDGRMRRLLSDGARSIRFIGELPVCDTPEQWDVWMLYEALLNHAFTHLPLRVVCTYDERVMPETVLQASRRAHPHIHHGDWRDGEWHDSRDYAPTEMVRSLMPQPQRLPDLRELPAAGDPRSFRTRLQDELDTADVPAEMAQGMLVAAGEVFANAVRHADGPPAVRVGRVDGAFVCEMADRGGGLDDPLAGYLPPRQGGVAGAGLWVARQLASRLELLPTPGGGLTARLWA